MRILFVTSSRIGDAVLSTGLLDHLLRRHPRARVTLVCGPLAADLFARMPGREETILLRPRRFDGHWLELWWRTVRVRWDLVVDLRGSALAFLLPARRRAVMRGGRRPGLRVGHLGAVLGLDPPPLPVAWTAAADRARAAALLPETERYVGLGPTANWDPKIWPPGRFADLYARLAAGPLAGARAVVLGGPGEAERARAAPLLAALPSAIDLVGTLALPEVAACLARCALFVGNDSGLMHLAAAAGAPTLGLFGPSRADQYAPAGRRAGFVSAPGPAGAAPIEGISVAAAFAAACGLLLSPAADPPSPA